METIIKDQVTNAFTSSIDTSGQPWYWRWGIAALGSIGGVIAIGCGLSSLIATHVLDAGLEFFLGTLLICFEATALAKGLNWQFCQVLVGVSEKVSPLMRTVVYAIMSIVIISVVSISSIIWLLPTMAVAAAYFLLFLDQRRSGDSQPVVDDSPDFEQPTNFA